MAVNDPQIKTFSQKLFPRRKLSNNGPLKKGKREGKKYFYNEAKIK